MASKKADKRSLSFNKSKWYFVALNFIKKRKKEFNGSVRGHVSDQVH
jgi:hypothetical protein